MNTSSTLGLAPSSPTTGDTKLAELRSLLGDASRRLVEAQRESEGLKLELARVRTASSTTGQQEAERAALQTEIEALRIEVKGMKALKAQGGAAITKEALEAERQAHAVDAVELESLRVTHCALQAQHRATLEAQSALQDERTALQEALSRAEQREQRVAIDLPRQLTNASTDVEQALQAHGDALVTEHARAMEALRSEHTRMVEANRCASERALDTVCGGEGRNAGLRQCSAKCSHFDAHHSERLIHCSLLAHHPFTHRSQVQNDLSARLRAAESEAAEWRAMSERNERQAQMAAADAERTASDARARVSEAAAEASVERVRAAEAAATARAVQERLRALELSLGKKEAERQLLRQAKEQLERELLATSAQRTEQAEREQSLTAEGSERERRERERLETAHQQSMNALIARHSEAMRAATLMSERQQAELSEVRQQHATASMELRRQACRQMRLRRLRLLEFRPANFFPHALLATHLPPHAPPTVCLTPYSTGARCDSVAPGSRAGAERGAIVAGAAAEASGGERARREGT